MIKKAFIILALLIFILNNRIINARETEEECKTNATNCPALPGECVAYEGEWIGTWIPSVTKTFYSCEYANVDCEGKSASYCASLWDEEDPYAPNDFCQPFNLIDEGYCDSEYWTTCCNLTDEPNPTETPSQTATPSNPPNTPTPEPDPSEISGSFYLYDGAGVTGDFCGGQNSIQRVNISGAYISLISDNDVRNYVLPTTSSFNIDTSSLPSEQTWDIRLTLNSNLTEEDLMVCACPSATDANNPYRCSYFSISDDETDVDFYLKPYNETDAWFQIFGGNIFACTSISSIIPVTSCLTSGTCTTNLIDSINNNALSSGFLLVSTNDNTSIQTSEGINQTRSYINSSDRSDNQNSYATSVQVNQYGYDYYYNKLAGEIDFTQTESFDLDTLKADQNWSSTESNIIYVSGSLEINETQNWDIASGETVIVLVSGDLDINDAVPVTAPYKITSVTEGGFLAFIVDNNIYVDANLGYSIDPASPSIVAVNNTNANLEGLFIADNLFRVEAQSDTTVPDLKFIGAGTFVGWGGVDLLRDFDDGNIGRKLNSMQAVENFIFRPDFVQNFPDELKVVNQNWQEKSPRNIRNL